MFRSLSRSSSSSSGQLTRILEIQTVLLKCISEPLSSYAERLKHITVTKRQFCLALRSNKIHFLKLHKTTQKTGCIVLCSLCTPCRLYGSVCHKETHTPPCNTHYCTDITAARTNLQWMPSNISSPKKAPISSTPTDGRTEGHDEPNIRLFHLCECY